MEDKLVIYQVKWYAEKEKTYKEEFCRSLQKCFEKACNAIDNEGSKYFTINQITIK